MANRGIEPDLAQGRYAVARSFQLRVVLENIRALMAGKVPETGAWPLEVVPVLERREGCTGQNKTPNIYLIEILRQYS